MDNVAFLKEIKPIILSKIKQYGRYIRGYEYQDLLNEGYAAALEAIERWNGLKSIDKKKANVKSWTWLRIDCRFKELGKIGYTYEDSLDDFDFEIGSEYFDKAMEDFFEIPESPLEERTREDVIKEEYDACLGELNKIFAGNKEKYEQFLTIMLDNDYSPTATAKALGVTTARISQIVKKFKRLMEYGKGTSLAA